MPENSDTLDDVREMLGVKDIQKFSLQPGDRLLIHTNGAIAPEAALRIHRMFEEWAGGGVPIMVVPGYLKVSVVSPEADTRSREDDSNPQT